MAKKKQEVSLNVDELKNFLKHIIANNQFIQKRGKVPVAIEVVGESGLGKTSAILQTAQELGLAMVKLNLAQIEELGDLVGFPIRQFEMKKENDKETVWVDEHLVKDYTDQEYRSTGLNRMSYCPPEWISNKGEGGILLLDDWNRADIRFIQAVMELIDRQTYISWTLPKNWHIVLSSNPDDGNYNVQSVDQAQRTRYISTNLKFDVKCWAVWAEQNEIDGRCINFLLKHPELITGAVNARAATMFFNSLSSLQSFSASLPLIEMIGEGSVGADFSTTFTMFINNRLDQLISPEEMLTGEKEKVLKAIKSVVGDLKKGSTKDDDKYRADIAAILGTRLINYSLYLAKEKDVNDAMVVRIGDIISSGVFNNDISYRVVRDIYNGDSSKFKKLTMNKDCIAYIMKN